MGSGSFDASAYRAYTSTTVGKTTDDVFVARNIHKDLNPFGVKIRESRDSADNPQSTPIIVALDVTGSMGMLADVLAREGLGTLFNEILDRKTVSDPHLMFMAVGDVDYDSAPLQVSQFEADNRIVEQLTQIFIEHGGGGNNHESYDLPWYFAARHTEIDSMIKRGKRGYLFTVGDEEAPMGLTKSKIKKFIGDDIETNLTAEELLAEVERKYDVFHIVVAEGSHASRYMARVKESWTKLLKQHVIILQDHKLLAETIVSAIDVVEGLDAVKATTKFGHIVHEAVKHLPARRPVAALTA